MKSNQITTIRYMGNKNRLVDFIIPEILKITKKGDVICDLMAGTNVIAYELKKRNTVLTNDIQYYSYVISKAIIENTSELVDSKIASEDLKKNYDYNMVKKKFSYFDKYISDTYFSQQQCREIDSIRYAIDNVENEYKKSLYLTALMVAMSKCESTTGHFAQYLDKNHKRIQTIRKKSIWDEFIVKCNDFINLSLNKNNSKSFNLNYRDFFCTTEFDSVNCFYIDTPYTGDQYSRFYHILETVCKYDCPEVEYKGKYRTDRFPSNFSLRSKVKDEFKFMLDFLSINNKKVVLSYSNRGLIPIDELEFIFHKRFKNVKLITKKYNHSSQGKGIKEIEEVLFVAFN